jgi:hypothetical protein
MKLCCFIIGKWMKLEISCFFSYVMMGGVHCVFTEVLTIYQIYHTWIHSLPHSPLSFPPIPGIVSTGLIFPFIYVCTQCFHYIHPIPSHLPQDRTCSALLFCPPVLQFCERKKMTFLFRIATQGVSLWHFHVYMYYN